MIEDHGLEEWGRCKAEDEFIDGMSRSNRESKVGLKSTQLVGQWPPFHALLFGSLRAGSGVTKAD